MSNVDGAFERTKRTFFERAIWSENTTETAARQGQLSPTQRSVRLLTK